MHDLPVLNPPNYWTHSTRSLSGQTLTHPHSPIEPLTRLLQVTRLASLKPTYQSPVLHDFTKAISLTHLPDLPVFQISDSHDWSTYLTLACPAAPAYPAHRTHPTDTQTGTQTCRHPTYLIYSIYKTSFICATPKRLHDLPVLNPPNYWTHSTWLPYQTNSSSYTLPNGTALPD